MENNGLLFIPDISGFTRFVNRSEIGHSRLIIQELLEIIINSNRLGLEVSEIEGDAILFYRFGESPDMKELFIQVEKMFCDFHKSLIAYDQRKYCQCKACQSAVDLTLKIITHYGEFTGYNVKNFSKLIGKDVIVAHQLLKNDIEQNEYWLVTNNVLRDNPPSSFAEWMKWNSSIKQTEDGEIRFYYTQLSRLKNEIKPDPPRQPELSEKVKVMSFSEVYEADIITLFHATGNFHYRHRWLEGVKKVEEVNHFLPRVGMKCRCILDDGQVNIYSSSYSYSDGKIEFSETDEDKESLVYFTLEKTGERKTRLTVDFYLKAGIFERILFNIGKRKKLEGMYRKSLINLRELVKEIKLPS